ncbi:D-aspartate oxidase isoform X2 [Hyla sarda]|uniref:D-aspartate oxidase isoform X2 n=1 Tax=Hyla sarda TaxID=327740 RepID=UPI0024C3A3CB|nr:D-aspartate oxidase isoform X2 [Hyla sarda]
MPVEKIKVAVIGGGLVGLSTALCITESLPQCTITVISEEFSPNTTSDVAAGCLIPHSYPDTSLDQQKSWFKETFDYLFKIANSSEAGEAGIHLISGIKSNGGYLERRKINNVWDLHGIYDVVVNCSGLGSRHLFGDHSIYPVKGQVLEVNAPWIKHFIRDGDGNTYIYPGISCVTLGGTRQNGVWSNLPNEQASKGILDRCCHLEPSLCEVSVIQEKVGLRPTRSALRIEKDILIKNGKQLTVVHNYGHGGGGYSIHWGTARKVSKLLQEVIPLPHNVYTKSKL